jgi:hypothetical protein
MHRVSLVLLASLAVAGCKKDQPVQPQQATAAGMPADLQQVGGQEVKGKVVEKLDASPYTYLKLQTAQGEAWAAVPKTDVPAGAEVTIAGAVPMQNWESKTLARKWDMVYFGTLAGPGAQAAGMPPAMGGGMAPAGMGGGMPPPGMGGAPGQAPTGPESMGAAHAAAAAGPQDAADVKVPKAGGAEARTVAEAWGQRTALKEKPVTIRGKVVKFNQGIMGKNWVHLRDGSGTAGKDNDITITTGDVVKVGDVVVAKGTLRVDKDFGAGYAYPVIVEDAKLTK